MTTCPHCAAAMSGPRDGALTYTARPDTGNDWRVTASDGREWRAWIADSDELGLFGPFMDAADEDAIERVVRAAQAARGRGRG